MWATSPPQKVFFTQVRRMTTTDQILQRLDPAHQVHGADLPFPHGAPGWVVAWESGLGDGAYPVRATLVDLGPPWGERIQRITIDFFTP